MTFKTILSASKGDFDSVIAVADIEKETDPLEVLKKLNNKYTDKKINQRNRYLNLHLDRGQAVVNALKTILGARCQICNIEGFEKKNGQKYIEGHHLIELAKMKPGSLCSENIILVCANCHRELHYGKNKKIQLVDDIIHLELGEKIASVLQNTVEYLSTLLK